MGGSVRGRGGEYRIREVRKAERGVLFFCMQRTAYEMATGDWSLDVCSSDLDLCVFFVRKKKQ